MLKVILTACAAFLLGSVVVDAERYLYALDFLMPLTAPTARCMKISLYSTVFLRAFPQITLQDTDKVVCDSIANAKKAGLGVELFMVPLHPSIMTANAQIDTLLKGLRGCGVELRRVWLTVTMPMVWLYQAQQSVEFINRILTIAGSYGIEVGVYTSASDWSQITKNTTALVQTPKLWYYNVERSGSMGESAMDFVDFKNFGPWVAPIVKQFGQQVPVCGMTVNRDCYADIEAALNQGGDVRKYSMKIGEGVVVK